MPKGPELQEAISEQHTQYLKNQPTTLRRCLSCDHWMHSTGTDHRICNTCKRLTCGQGGRFVTHSRVGERVL